MWNILYGSTILAHLCSTPKCFDKSYIYTGWAESNLLSPNTLTRETKELLSAHPVYKDIYCSKNYSVVVNDNNKI